MYNNKLQHKIDAQPDYGFLTVQLPKGQTIKVEAGSMASMDSHISMKTKLKGGLKRFLTKENLFINEFTASHKDGEISIAPGAPGEIAHVYLNNETLYLQGSCFLASSPDIDIETKWQGITKSFFSGNSLFLTKCKGTGDIWFNSFGAIIEIDVQKEYIVDTNHVVAFTEGLEYEVTTLGSYKSLFFSGEGFVCRFKGSGKLWIQTRKLLSFTNWLYAFRPSKGD